MATAHGTLWPTEDRAAWVFTPGAGPFALVAGMLLTVKVNQEDPEQSVEMLAADFVDIANATADEVAAVLDREVGGARGFESSGTVGLMTIAAGDGTYIEVTGGTANAVLAFPTTEERGTSDGTLTAIADPQGRVINLSWYLWSTAIALTQWDGEFKILAKQGEYPREHDDPRALEIFSATYGTPFSKDQQTFQVTNLAPGTVYYFTFFFRELGTGVWFRDDEASFAWGYPFGQWGHADFLFRRSPATAQVQDESGDWENWLSIFGILLDGAKTEAEHLLLAYDMPAVPAYLIPHHDYLIGWPTNYELPENDQRRETMNAIPLWGKKGREVSATFPLEQVTHYDLDIADGWKYLLLHNDPTCTHIDLSDPAVPLNLGRQNDTVKYHPDMGHWHNVNGWGFFFYPIPGVSGPFTQTMINKVHRIMGVMKPSFVDYDVSAEPAPDEEAVLPCLDEIPPAILSILSEEAPLYPLDEGELEVWPAFLLLHNDVDRLHNSWAVHPHNAIVYMGDPKLLLVARFDSDLGGIHFNYVRDRVNEFAAVEAGAPAVAVVAGAFGGNALDLVGSKSVIWDGVRYVTGICNEFCVRVRVRLGYDTAPAVDQHFFHTYISSAVFNGDAAIIHESGGDLVCYLTDASGVSIVSLATAWAPVKDTWYEIEFNLEAHTLQEARVFVDGVLLGGMVATVGTLNELLTYLMMGRPAIGPQPVNSFMLDELHVYNEAQHTANYTPATDALYGYALEP